MENNFLYNFEDRLNQLLERDGTHEKDVERKALFYIIAGNSDLYKKVGHIYDFLDHSIKTECLESEDVDFCSSSRKLIKLAFNLYNGYSADVLDTFNVLDDDNFNLAMNALRIRFNRGQE